MAQTEATEGITINLLSCVHGVHVCLYKPKTPNGLAKGTRG